MCGHAAANMRRSAEHASWPRGGWKYIVEFIDGTSAEVNDEDLDPSSSRLLTDSEGHEIEIVESDHGSARWKCSCGASSSGRWFGSPEEGVKAAERHLAKHPQ